MRPVLFISKRLFLSVILILIGLSLHGQNEKKYYAIDGTEWGRQSDRDKKEQLMWEKIDLDLKEALAIGRLGHTKGEENYKKFKTLFEKCKRYFDVIRKADQGKDILQNPQFRVFIKEHEMPIRIGKARNKEKFNLMEYADCFDAVLREYSFNSKVVEELSKADGKIYNLKFVLKDFEERMDIVIASIEEAIEIVTSKEGKIKKLAQIYREREKALQEREKKKQPL